MLRMCRMLSTCQLQNPRAGGAHRKEGAMPMYEILVALGVIMALAADSLTVIDRMRRLVRKLRRWWKKHKRD